MKRSYAILLISFSVFLLVLVADKFGLFERGAFKPEPLLKTFAPQEITKIEISYLLDGVKLEKGDGGWNVSGLLTKMREELLRKEGKDPSTYSLELKKYKADADSVDKFLRNFAELRVVSIASMKLKDDSIFELGPTAKSVVFYSGEKRAASLQIGKSEGTGFYVKREGEDAVYFTDGIVDVNLAIDGWRDKVVWDIPADTISEVEVKKGDESFYIRRDKDKWYGAVEKSEKEAGLDERRVSDFLDKISRIEAVRFGALPPEGDGGFSKPTLTLTVRTTLGLEKSLVVGDKVEGGYFNGKLADNNSDIYLLNASLISSIPTLPSLLKKE